MAHSRESGHPPERVDHWKRRVAQALERGASTPFFLFDMEPVRERVAELEERKAKLQGGVAVIRVGAATEPELKQKKQQKPLQKLHFLIVLALQKTKQNFFFPNYNLSI